ncbi:unnamed protein product [marine sediment metagenome]|uniref:Uncharacterized protein n=1 Tax=marine sediment metagenome TaxID=412755 RepID=X1KK87_9ZZZZ
MEKARFCPVCCKAWDLSHGDFCPTCKVFTLAVYDYGEGFVVHECGDYPISDLERDADG